MTPDQHASWLRELVAILAGREDVLGVVGMGSTADWSRVDEWSDHDFAVVVIPGAEPRYRGTTDWMPQPEHVVLVLEEPHGGGKAVYDDGHFIEWGVATLGSLATWAAEDYTVFLDRGGVAHVMEQVASTPFPSNVPNLGRDAALFLTALLHGVGRARRGEVLSAGAIIRGDGVQTLVRAVRAHTDKHSPALDRLDRLDGLRRVEWAFPDLAREIADAVAQDPESAARALLAVADRHLGVGPEGLSAAARRAVMLRLGWLEAS